MKKTIILISAALMILTFSACSNEPIDADYETETETETISSDMQSTLESTTGFSEMSYEVSAISNCTVFYTTASAESEGEMIGTRVTPYCPVCGEEGMSEYVSIPEENIGDASYIYTSDASCSSAAHDHFAFNYPYSVLFTKTSSD